MPRPRICRRIRRHPNATYFKPAGVRLSETEEISLTLEEYEAIRLIDLDETEQKKAGEMMNISQPTLSRLLKNARRKIADAIIHGKAIRIEGGNYRFR